MTKYVELNAMLQDLDKLEGLHGHHTAWAQSVRQFVNKFPAVDAKPVVYAEWVWNPDGMDWGLGAWECNRCCCNNNGLPMDSRINPLMFAGSRYCPNCGAIMIARKGTDNA